MLKYRLEYSEAQGNFHQELLEYNGEKRNCHRPGTFGWATIDETHDEYIQSSFIDFMDVKYKKKLTLKEVTKEWGFFIKAMSILIVRKRIALELGQHKSQVVSIENYLG